MGLTRNPELAGHRVSPPSRAPPPRYSSRGLWLRLLLPAWCVGCPGAPYGEMPARGPWWPPPSALQRTQDCWPFTALSYHPGRVSSPWSLSPVPSLPLHEAVLLSSFSSPFPHPLLPLFLLPDAPPHGRSARLTLTPSFSPPLREQGSCGRVVHVQWNLLGVCQQPLNFRKREEAQVTALAPSPCGVVCRTDLTALTPPAPALAGTRPVGLWGSSRGLSEAAAAERPPVWMKLI